MAAGTWNQGRLKKRVTKVGLKDYPTIEFRDTSLTSEEIFNVVEFPSRLTAGKNLIKIRANNNNTLVKNSKIHIEILDFNGDPIYYEPLNYVEHDGTRVISIHIFSESTSPGLGTIYIAGRTKIDLSTGANIPFSRNYNDKNYLNLPNILWSRSISIAPENSKNNTEIIFTRPHPKATVRERVNKYFQPINLTNVDVKRNGTGTVIIKAIPSNVPSISMLKAAGSQVNYEGAATPKTPQGSAGTQAVMPPIIETTGGNNEPLEVSSAEIITVATFGRLETIGFALSSSMEGGSITVVNPYIEVQNNTAVDSNGFILPGSQVSEQSTTVNSGLVQLSGSYTFTINTMLSTTKANVFQTSGFKNEIDNTYGAFNVNLLNNASGYSLNNIKSTSNFTCSFVAPFVLSETEQSQSFAEIVLSNIEPATGDVHKIQTLYKPAGQFGDFIDAGYVNVEQVEVLEDVTSYESVQSIGMIYNRIGKFTDLSDFNSYWETANGSISTEVALTAAFEPDLLLDGIELTPDSAFDLTSNRFGYLHLKSTYHPKVYANTRYMLSFNAVADDSFISTDVTVQYPTLDIYISGSNSSIESDSQYINQYLVSSNNSPTNEFNLGTRISTIELQPGSSYDEVPILSYFRALKEENIDVYFVIRRGKWTVSNISLLSDKQTGFSPNYTRINTRIPSAFLETPLTFKFLYYDINNNKAQAETLVYPVTFYGDNLVIAGGNNLLTGSVFIGNTTGAGIELAGVNSGYIRSIGYEGFKSASRTDKPGGFMLYTGSVLPNGADNYDGVGIEIVQDSSSYFKFDTTNGIDVRAKKFFIGTEDSQFVSGSTGNIEISSSNFHLKPDGGLIIGGDTVINADLSVNNLFVPASTTHADARAYISSSGVSKFSGDGAGEYKVVFDGAGTSTIAGWTINDQSLEGTNIIISASGDIQTADFESALVGTGKGYRLGADGIAEFEEARIRGTLSTAVFEKETISAVGGAVIIANATALKSGSMILSQSLLGQLTPSSSIPVDNVAGFAAGEFVIAKAVHNTGFTEEIMKVWSSSLATDNHILFVSRSMNGNLITSMSSGQVLVSQGQNGTGYILLNATSGSETPYIDIVERTGDNVNDLDIKVRLGDLSGINDTINGVSVSGYGLYTDNAFLKGGIAATYGKIGGFGINSASISSSNNNLILRDSGQITGSTVLFTGGTIGGFTIDGHSLTSTGIEINDSTQDLFISSSDFKVTHAGDITASNADFDGYAVARSLRQKTVTITQANMHQYIMAVKQVDDIPIINNSADGMVTYTSKLVLDGSLSGSIVSHVIIDIDMYTEEPTQPVAASGRMFVEGIGTTPASSSHTYITIDVNGVTTVGPQVVGTAGTQGPAGALRAIVPPPTIGAAKVPVTIDIAADRRVDFFIPIGSEMGDQGFGLINENLQGTTVMPATATPV